MTITNDMFLTAAWLVLFGLTLGMMLTFLILHLIFPDVCMPRGLPLSYDGDVRRTVGALQQLQVLIGRENAERNPNLADLLRLIRTVQRTFGRRASLESVIQALVAQDIERQLAVRKRPRMRPEKTAVRQKIAV